MTQHFFTVICCYSDHKGLNSCLFLLQQIMKDRWINSGFEEDELKPYTEPELDITDQKRIGTRTFFLKNETQFTSAGSDVLRVAQHPVFNGTKPHRSPRWKGAGLIVRVGSRKTQFIRSHDEFFSGPNCRSDSALRSSSSWFLDQSRLRRRELIRTWSQNTFLTFPRQKLHVSLLPVVSVAQLNEVFLQTAL